MTDFMTLPNPYTSADLRWVSPFSFRSIVEGEKLQKVTGSLLEYRPLWSQELLHLPVFFFFFSQLSQYRLFLGNLSGNR